MAGPSHAEENVMSKDLRRATLPLVLLSLVAALLLWSGRLSSEAAPAATPTRASVPAAQAVGKVIFDFSSTPDQTTTVRSFAWSGSSTASSGSGGGSSGGGFTGGNPTVNLDTGPASAALLKALSTGAHLPTVTVVLYRPGTTTRLDQWKFLDVLFREVRQTQSSPGQSPREQVTWTWGRVRRDVYAANGTTIVGTFCWSISTVSSACP
jgi:type VI protein secretion system component Hcp